MSTSEASAGQNGGKNGLEIPSSLGQGLPTPEQIPGVDDKRLVADQVRRQLSPNPPAAAQRTSVAKHRSGNKKGPDNEKRAQKKANARAYNQAIDRIMAYEPTAYYDILKLSPEASPEDVSESYKRLLYLTDPRQTTNSKAKRANERIKQAARKLDLAEDNMDYDNTDVNLNEDEMDAEEALLESELPGIYDTAGNCLNQLMEDPKASDPLKRLEDCNEGIKSLISNAGRPKADVSKYCIKIQDLLTLFESVRKFRARLEENPEDAEAIQALQQYKDQIKGICPAGLPFDISADRSSNDQSGVKANQKVPTIRYGEATPGLTIKGHKIAAYRPSRMGNRFYVEKEVNDLPTWFAETANEIGGRAAKAYLEWEDRVQLGQGTRKYRKSDLDKYNGVIHVGCKAVKTQMVPKDGRKPRRPLTDILAMFDGKPTPMVYSDLVAIIGAADASEDVAVYYNQRGLQCPWNEPPERRLKVIESDENSSKDFRSTSSIETTNTEIAKMIRTLQTQINEDKSQLVGRIDKLEDQIATQNRAIYDQQIHITSILAMMQRGSGSGQLQPAA